MVFNDKEIILTVNELPNAFNTNIGCYVYNGSA